MGKCSFSTRSKCILETQLQVTELAVLCKRMDLGM